MPKPWYTSKTLWVNFLALAAGVVQGAFGWVVAPEYQAMALGVINLVLRMVTKTEVVWLALIMVFGSAMMAHALTFTPTGTIVQATYTEPTTNADGTPLADLASTQVRYRLGTGTPVVCATVPASLPAGGGLMSVTCTVPIAEGQAAEVAFSAVAVDTSGNESIPTADVRVRIDRLAPATPT